VLLTYEAAAIGRVESLGHFPLISST
jgi:hypothetical protein